MKPLETLNPNAQHWARLGIEWADQFWDEEQHLLIAMQDPEKPSQGELHHHRYEIPSGT